jgi:hypothetical protein
VSRGSRRRRPGDCSTGNTCQACHGRYIDPFGFALENYDAIGAWQTVDRLGGEIDSAADVFVGDAIIRVESPRQLMEALAASKYARHRFAEQLVSYAFDRLPNPQDTCLVDEARTLLEDDEMPLLTVWTQVASHSLFRRGAGASSP